MSWTLVNHISGLTAILWLRVLYVCIMSNLNLLASKVWIPTSFSLSSYDTLCRLRSYLWLAFVHFLGLGCPQVSKDTKLTQQILSEVGHKICTVEKCGFISEDALDICSRTKLAFFAADKHWVEGFVGYNTNVFFLANICHLWTIHVIDVIIIIFANM